MNYIKDVALYNHDGSVNVVVEICPNTDNKTELMEPNFNKLVCVRKVEGLYPFYYGSFPRTHAGDNDPLDMILFTDKLHSELDLVKVDVIGAIKTIDAGEQDDKIICVECDCGLLNVKKQLKQALKFLKRYKGKKADMTIAKKLASMAEAEEIIKEANTAYKTKNTVVVNGPRVVRKTNPATRIIKG
jgi:inorganic pyrophosphatase